MKVSNFIGLQYIQGIRGLAIKYRHTRRLLYKTFSKLTTTKISDAFINNFNFDIELSNSTTYYRAAAKTNSIALLQYACKVAMADKLSNIISIAVSCYASAHRQHKIVVTRGAMAFKKRGKESYILKDDRIILRVTLIYAGSLDNELLVQFKDECITMFTGRLDTELHANKLCFSEGIDSLLNSQLHNE